MPANDVQRVLLKLMTLMSTADGTMRDSELATISHLARGLPMFTGLDAETVITVADEAKALLDLDDGVEMMLDEAAQVLPKTLHATAYALMVEVAAADAQVRIEELNLLDMVREVLRIDPLTRAAIEESARVRYRRDPKA